MGGNYQHLIIVATMISVLRNYFLYGV